MWVQEEKSPTETQSQPHLQTTPYSYSSHFNTQSFPGLARYCCLFVNFLAIYINASKLNDGSRSIHMIRITLSPKMTQLKASINTKFVLPLLQLSSESKKIILLKLSIGILSMLNIIFSIDHLLWPYPIVRPNYSFASQQSYKAIALVKI